MRVKSICAALGEFASNHVFPLTLSAIAPPLQFAWCSLGNYSADALNVAQGNAKFTSVHFFYGMRENDSIRHCGITGDAKNTMQFSFLHLCKWGMDFRLKAPLKKHDAAIECEVYLQSLPAEQGWLWRRWLLLQPLGSLLFKCPFFSSA